jgi:hypothetical protein
MAATDLDSSEIESDEDAEKQTSELDPEKLLLRIKEWWREDYPHCSKWHEGAKKDFKIRSGDQWPDEDKEELDSVTKRPRLVFNQVDPVIDTVAGAEITNRQEVRYIGRQVGDAAVSDTLTEAGRWFRDECNAEHEESAAFTDAATCGMGWTETRLDYEINPDGDPVIERVNPREMLWDSKAKQANLRDARRLYRMQLDIPLNDAKSKWPEGLDGQELLDEDYDARWAQIEGDDETPYNVHRGGMPRTHDVDDQTENKRTVTVIQVQWYEREPFYRGLLVNPQTGQQDTSELSEEQHLQALTRAQQIGHLYRAVKQFRRVYYKAFVGGVVLEITKMVGPKGNRAEGFSLNPITGKWDNDKMMFYGLVRAMEGPQTFANKWLSTAVEIMARGAKGGLLLEEGAVVDVADFETDWAKPGRNAYLKAGAISGGKVQPKPETKFPNDFMQMTQFAISSIRDVTGVNLESSGAQDQEQAASLEYQRRQSATIILAPLFDSLKRYRRMQGKFLLFLITEYLSDGRLIRIVGEEGERYIPLIHDPNVVKYDVIVDDAPSSPSQKELVWNSMVQMLPMMQSVALPPEVYMILLEYSPMPASVVSKIKQAVQGAAQNQQGQPSPMDLVMMEKKADVEAEGHKTQIKLTSKQKENELDFMHKKRLAEIDIQGEIAKQRIAAHSKIQDAQLKQKQDNGAARREDMNAHHERNLRVAELQIDAYRAQSERMHGAEEKKRAAEEKKKAAEDKKKAAEDKKKEPKPPDHTPAILELIKHLGSQKKPSGIKKSKDGMKLVYED